MGQFNRKRKKCLSRGIKILIKYLFSGLQLQYRHFLHQKDRSTELTSLVFQPQDGLVEWLWDGQTLILKNDSKMLNSNTPRVTPFRKFKKASWDSEKGAGQENLLSSKSSMKVSQWAPKTPELCGASYFPLPSVCVSGGWDVTVGHRRALVQSGRLPGGNPARAARKFLRNLC